MVLPGLSGLGGFLDIWIAMPLGSISLVILAALCLRRQRFSKLLRLLTIAMLCIAAGLVFWIWIVLRHDYLIVGQSYSRHHEWTCHPEIYIPNDVTRHFVVAKYKENTSWVHCPELSQASFTVYDKYDVHAVNHVPNYGFECTSYFLYIIKHYDELPDVVFFVHGDPFEHCPNFIETIPHAHKHGFFMLSKQFDGFYANGHPSYAARHKFGDAFLRVWLGLGFGEPVPTMGSTYFNGQLAVTRERIRQRPKSFYKRAMALVTRDRDPDAYSWGRRGDGWLECCVFERIWPAVFGLGTPQEDVHMPKYTEKDGVHCED